MTDRIESFPPVAGKDAVLLILGSMPGEASLRKRQYYGHPHNAFWPFLGELLGFPPELPYELRLQRLVEAKIALWDVLASCVRQGSMDSGIKREQPNAIAGFLEEHPAIVRIAFNGGTAERLFHKHVAQTLPRPVELVGLPSTSPANASIPYARKLEQWRAALAICS